MKEEESAVANICSIGQMFNKAVMHTASLQLNMGDDLWPYNVASAVADLAWSGMFLHLCYTSDHEAFQACCNE